WVLGPHADGTYAVEVAAEDEAGNAAPPQSFPVVHVDNTAPEFTSHQLASDSVRQGQRISVELVTSESLSVLPTVRAIPRSGGAALPLGLELQQGLRATFGALVTSAVSDGVYDIEAFDFADLAGNSGESLSVGAVTVDTSPPGFD